MSINFDYSADKFNAKLVFLIFLFYEKLINFFLIPKLRFAIHIKKIINLPIVIRTENNNITVFSK